MDYAKIAEQVIQYVGGKKNIKSVAHCATRLRFQLRDNSLRNEEALSDLEGVKGVFLTQSQFQIIFGSGTVNLVCAEVQKQLGTLEEQASNEKEEKSGNAIQRFIKMLSDIFVPIIPAIVAGGLLMGLNNVLTSPLINGSSVIELYPQWAGLATAVNTFASAPFTFLPVLIGFSATKKFGGNAFLGAAMGMIMVHPDLLNAYQIGIADPPVWNILGLNVAAIGYQGTVLPVLAISWIIANIEKRLRKVTPSWLDNLTTPLLSILITSFLTFIFVGPVLREAGNLLAAGITWLYNSLGFVGGAIFGLTYAPITMTGMHHSFIAIETQLLADSVHTGGSFIFSTASMNNVAQGAAVLAVLLLTKNEKLKSICFPAIISGVFGVTEPAIYGITLQRLPMFVISCIGGSLSGAYAAFAGLKYQQMAGMGIFEMPAMFPQNGTGAAMFQCVIASAFAIIPTFIAAYVFYRDDHKEDNVTESLSEEVNQPIEGKIIPLNQVEDDAFSQEVLGKGIAIIPSEGKVYAPFDGTVITLFPTKHAIGIVSDNGCEVLIHIGMNTVQLNGKYFTSHVQQGDKVKKGQLLVEFDIDHILQEGYNLETPVIITNTKDYSNINTNTNKDNVVLVAEA